MFNGSVLTIELDVALLAEGVGRNSVISAFQHLVQAVALLAEGVGRNKAQSKDAVSENSRPPRGGRG